MIYVVEKPEDMTFAVKYDGEVQNITNIIYIVSARCGYGIAITVGGRKPQQKTGLSNIITIRIAGDGLHGNDVTECLTLHKGDYLIAKPRGEFEIAKPDEFKATYYVLNEYNGGDE